MPKMGRPKKDGVKANFYLDKDLMERLEAYSEETGRTKTKVLEMAIKEFLEKHAQEKSQL